MRRWISVREAAAHFSLPVPTLYSLIGRQLIPSDAILRLGRQIRVDVEAIERANTGREIGRKR